MTTGSSHQTMSSQEPQGFLSRMAIRVQQHICGLHGHDSLLHFEEGRMSLLCTSCGHESPGWDVKRGSVHRENAAPARPLVQMPLVGERHAA